MRALSFVCCTLAGLPYQVQEEPLFVVDYVNRQVRVINRGLCLFFSCALVCCSLAASGRSTARNVRAVESA